MRRRQLPRQQTLTELLGLARFPIYGLPKAYPHLTVCSFGVCGASKGKFPNNRMIEVNSLTLNFGEQHLKAGDEERTTPQFRVTSTDRTIPNISLPSVVSATQSTATLVDEIGRPYSRFATLVEAIAAKDTQSDSGAPCLIASFPSGHTTMAARFEQISKQNNEWNFVLETANIGIHGTTLGMTCSEAIILASLLAPINNNPTVIARYEHEAHQALLRAVGYDPFAEE